MTSRNKWDPTKLDNPEEESDRMIKQFSLILIDIIESFHNDQGDIRTTKSDLIVDSEIGPVVGDSKVDTEIDPDVGDSKIDSKVDPVGVESLVGPVVVENNKLYHLKLNGKKYRSKPKKYKRNQQ